MVAVDTNPIIAEMRKSAIAEIQQTKGRLDSDLKLLNSSAPTEIKTRTHAALREVIGTLKLLVRHHNDKVKEGNQLVESLARVIRQRLPSNGRLKVETSVYYSPQTFEQAFCIFSVLKNADLYGGVKVTSSEREARRIIEKFSLLNFVILTPFTRHGETTAYEHQIHRHEKRLTRDNRTEPADDNDSRLVRRAMTEVGVDPIETDIIYFRREIGREEHREEVNPHACYHDGHACHDYVTYEHFYRWSFKVDLMMPRSAGIALLQAPPTDFQI